MNGFLFALMLRGALRSQAPKAGLDGKNKG